MQKWGDGVLVLWTQWVPADWAALIPLSLRNVLRFKARVLQTSSRALNLGWRSFFCSGQQSEG